MGSPRVERLVESGRQSLGWRGDGETEPLKRIDGFRWEVSYERLYLPATPFRSAFVEASLPTRDRIESALGDEELDHIFQARPKTRTANWNVKGRDVVWLRMP